MLEEQCTEVVEGLDLAVIKLLFDGLCVVLLGLVDQLEFPTGQTQHIVDVAAAHPLVAAGVFLQGLECFKRICVQTQILLAQCLIV